MEKKLKIQNNKNKYDWLVFVSKNRYVNGVITKLTVDFEKCSFLEPFHLVSLACLIEEYKMNNVELQFIESENLALNEYLKRINFIVYWDNNFNRNAFQQSKKDTNLFLWKLENTRLLPYTFFARQYFEDHFVKDRDMQVIGVILAELFNNIIDHSKSIVSGFTTTQFFPNNKKISISICDNGIGIVESVKRYLFKKSGTQVLSDFAFEKALLKGFSTESTPQNRGYGLDTLLTIVQTNNGKLRIQSNDILYICDQNTAKIVHCKDNFLGTIIEITLNVDNFHEKEELNSDIFDF